MLWIPALLVMAMACGGSSAIDRRADATTNLQSQTAASQSQLDRYSDFMNPILQSHTDSYSSLNSEIQSFQDALLEAPQNGTDLTSALAGILGDLEKIVSSNQTVFTDNILDWIELDPPSEANRFHDLVFEMLLYRRNGIFMFEFEVQQISGAAFSESADEFDKSDRVWLQIISEAQKLGWAELIRE